MVLTPVYGRLSKKCVIMIILIKGSMNFTKCSSRIGSQYAGTSCICILRSDISWTYDHTNSPYPTHRNTSCCEKEPHCDNCHGGFFIKCMNALSIASWYFNQIYRSLMLLYSRNLIHHLAPFNWRIDGLSTVPMKLVCVRAFYVVVFRILIALFIRAQFCVLIYLSKM